MDVWFFGCWGFVSRLLIWLGGMGESGGGGRNLDGMSNPYVGRAGHRHRPLIGRYMARLEALTASAAGCSFRAAGAG